MAIQVSRVLHAGYIFETEQSRILFDPIFENPFSRNCFAFPSVKFDETRIRAIRFSAVFISHYHDDHCSLDSLNLIDRSTPIFLYCAFDEMFGLIRELGFTNVHSIKLNDPIMIGDFKIVARQALDEDVDSIFEIHSHGLKILNVVDSWIPPFVLEQLRGNWDLILWPFQTMREIEALSPSRSDAFDVQLPHEFLEQIKLLAPKFLVASSCQFLFEPWSWLNNAFFPISYDAFRRSVESDVTEVLRIDPGCSFRLDANSFVHVADLDWIQKIGSQDVDYEYRADAKIPPTSEIATHFDALGVNESQRVLTYCEVEIPNIYSSLEEDQNSNFVWKLCIYDHLGQPTEFYYDIRGHNVSRVDQTEFSWLTEVPMARLYGAIENGESLSSMYIRVNDYQFVDSIEKLLKTRDILEDPLIRILYEGKVASYQIAQMEHVTGPL